MNRYLNEVARVIRGLGLTVKPDEENESLEITDQDSPLCVAHLKGIRFHRDHINTKEKESLLSKIQDHYLTISEYISAYEKSPELKAIGLDDGYRLLAEYNRTVLAVKDHNQYGYQFATWDRTYGDTGLTLGHYTYDYETAKEEFAIRSGLVSKHKIFEDFQMKDIYRALDFYRNENPDLTIKQDDELKKIMDKIEYAVPDVESVLDTEQSSGMGMEM